MELKRRVASHPNYQLAAISKKISHWSNSDCIKYADELSIDYTDLIKLKKVTTYDEKNKYLFPLRKLAEIQPLSNSTEIEVKPSPVEEISPANSEAPVEPISLITFNVQTTNGSLFSLRMFSDSLIKDVKNKLAEEFAVVEESEQKLFHYRQELADDQSLCKLGISNGDCLALGCDMQVFYINFTSQINVLTVNEYDSPSVLVRLISSTSGIQQNSFHLSLNGCLIDALEEPVHSIGLVPFSTIYLVAPSTLDWQF